MDNAVIIMILWWCCKCVMMIVMMMTKMMTKMTTVMKTMILQGVQIANCPFHGHSYLFTSRITTMICWDHLGRDDYHEHLIIIIDLLLMIWYCKLKSTSVLKVSLFSVWVSWSWRFCCAARFLQKDNSTW